MTDLAACRRELRKPHLHDLLLRTRTALVLCSVLRFNDHLHAAEAVLAPLAGAVQATPNVYLATLYYASLSALRHQQGRLHQVLAILHQALALAERQAGPTDNPFTGVIHIALGNLQLGTGRSGCHAALASSEWHDGPDALRP